MIPPFRPPSFFVRSGRLLWRNLGFGRLQVAYHDKYHAAFPDVPNDPLRAERILAFLASEGLVLEKWVDRPEPVSLRALGLVHSDDYLDSIHDVRTLTSIMGVEIGEEIVDRLIDLQRLQTGGTVMATRHALRHGVAVNLGGGFHHAMADRGGGFCLLNDVAVAIADARNGGLGGRVLIVDLDLHDGDGTRAIFAEDSEVHTFSIHARHWGPTAAVSSTSIELGNEVGDATYLDAIRKNLPSVFERVAPRLVMYVAGCDPAHDDDLGDWLISPQAMLERDLLVWELARSHLRPCPLVIVLAGGYGGEAWRYTARFLAALGRGGRSIEPPSTKDITLQRYRHLSRLFDNAELSGAGGDTDFGLTEQDLYLPGWGQTKETRFLGFYSRHGMELMLERTGFLDHLRDIGFPHPLVDFQLDDPAGHTMRLFGDLDRHYLLIEMCLDRDRQTVQGHELLSIEWLLMQNPLASFTPSRPRLPGQKHPGLGMLYEIVALLTIACERLHLDGLVFTPSEFHVAVYAKGRLAFPKPSTRDRFEALLELYRDTPLALATAAVAEGRVIDAASGEVFHWRPEPMVLPVSDRLRDHMEELQQEAVEQFSFRLSSQSASSADPEAPLD